ncbi:MAG: hypothetical protein ACK5RK_13865 [Betaproteobacteria bacterium]
MTRYLSLSIATRCPRGAAPALGHEPALSRGQWVNSDPRTVDPGGGTGT